MGHQPTLGIHGYVRGIYGVLKIINYTKAAEASRFDTALYFISLGKLRNSDLIGMGAWKIGMTEAKTRKIFALISPLRARRRLVGVISVITISLVVTEDTT
jgi:hypothetical protein